MKTRQTSDVAPTTPATHNTNSSAPPQAAMTSSSPTVKNRQTGDQKRARYGLARELPVYQQKPLSEKSKADIRRVIKPDGQWDRFTKAVTASGELRLPEVDKHNVSQLADWISTSPASLYNLSITLTSRKRESVKLLLAELQWLSNHASILSMPNTKIHDSDDDVIKLAKALKKNKILTTLKLESNQINSKGATALADALIKNETLTTLHISENKIGDKGAIALASALIQNKSLKTLYISDNEIGDEGAIAMANALMKNEVLRKLRLGYNKISSTGAKALANALMENKTLVTLRLNTNNIGDTGAIALAEALAENTTLRILELSFNRISRKGAIALANALKTNKTLHRLYLLGNKIDIEGVAKLGEALSVNKILTFLDVGIDDSNACPEEFSLLLKRNRRLHLEKPAAEILYRLFRASTVLKNLYIPEELMPLILEHLTISELATFVKQWRDDSRTSSPSVTTTTAYTGATTTTTTTTNTRTTTTTANSTFPNVSPAALVTNLPSASPAILAPTATAATIKALLAAPRPDVALLRWIKGHANPAAALNWVDPANGYTLLHYAVRAEQIAVIRSLLIRGIDREKRDHKNQTAAQMAREIQGVQRLAGYSTNQTAAAIAALLQ